MSDLAGHLRAASDCVVWENMQLGPAGSPRPDVFMLRKSYKRFHPVAYECKVSMTDFRRDVTAGKWQSYLKYASGVYFAAPEGMLKKTDVPVECGLILRYESGWRPVKKPTLRVISDLPRDTWMKLVIDGINKRSEEKIKNRHLREWDVYRKVRERYGEKLAKLISDRDEAEFSIRRDIQKLERERDSLDEYLASVLEPLKRRMESEKKGIDLAHRQLCLLLGLQEDAPNYEINHALIMLRRAVSESELHSCASRALQDIRERADRFLCEIKNIIPAKEG
jgi:hypothetical protein